MPYVSRAKNESGVRDLSCSNPPTNEDQEPISDRTETRLARLLTEKRSWESEVTQLKTAL